MKITPMDISNKEFKKVLRGYDSEEVDEFLDKIVEEYEVLFKENAILKEKMSVMDDRIDHYSNIENTIQNTLVLAQNAAEQAKKSAQKEADLIVRNSNETAQKILDKAHSDVIRVNDEYERLKQDFIRFRVKFRSFMNVQLETFDDLEKDFAKNYNLGIPLEEDVVEEEEEKEQIINKEIEVQKDESINSDDLSAIKSFFAKNS
ncbi:DivIVA domain-containing protein [Clostridium algidicarnis]|uniref:DivIVA domain-containing protein n=1 Tax=Clostridium algidicarnis TaxID=37659 RepID=A0ABS6C2Z6_9CLOT|nr:DivIVA domain-containing protein [Clostridium algidicarnis]MBB6631248.1 DivIVA domain-containing protein [Clostridium algidicarnis]MBB6697633.1 DivIVA domain-containing protein [Clostridium algidicarnis]MBU3193840.1 DivIVA domain-containing protein [Clostridium algidicarnis]MBU3203279.1 DivIVA domain-containing protein [Clostridium algidicarnis]MBU3211433.1 DivIVA domain-containing protein [Clostridium algidicarnis]